MEIKDLYEIFLQYPHVTTDTRNIQKGDLFFALKGTNFNGNNFAEQAVADGAAYCILDEKPATENEKFIVVENALDTLQQLAKYHRETFEIPFIAITGSNGKTTTKELTYSVLSQKYTTYFTQGNLNNHIGIPLTLLSVKKDAEMAIIEMGANHQKEIEGYCKYVKPTIGIITNCGKAHLEGFGGIEGVRKGKGELFDYIRENGGAIFAYDDYDYFHTMSHGISEIHWYGSQNGEVVGQVVSSDPFLDVKIGIEDEGGIDVKTSLVGSYNLPNVLCATAVGNYFEVSKEQIVKAIESYQPTNSRSQLINYKNDSKVILDAYNANPTSMTLAIENFAKIKGDKKILMLGGMMELGDTSIQEHENILALIRKYAWTSVVLVGGDFGKINVAPYLYFPTSQEAKNWLATQDIHNAEILIKGSNSMKMNLIVN